MQGNRFGPVRLLTLLDKRKSQKCQNSEFVVFIISMLASLSE